MGASLCTPSKYSNKQPPSRVRFTNGKDKNRVHVDGYNERFAIPEGAFFVKLNDEKQCVINGSAFLPTGDIVLLDSHNRKIKMFTPTFHFVTFIDFPSTPLSLCASPNLPLVYVTFPDRVRQIHVDGGQLRRSGFIKTPGECRGMCVNKYEGKALALTLDYDVGQVNLLTPGGNLQLEITNDVNDKPIFLRPEQLVVSKNLVLVVADKQARCVVGLRSDGDVVFRYYGVRNPSALVCDEQEYIYIAGQNTVHQITEEGELVKIFLTKAEIGFAPLSLSYYRPKRLLLATGKGHRVTVFKLTN